MRFETFAYLPPLSPMQVQKQVQHMLHEGYELMLEYAENPGRADYPYWDLWPLVTPKTNHQAARHEDLSPEIVLMHIDTCTQRNPYATVRLSGYCPTKQAIASQFIVKAGQEGR